MHTDRMWAESAALKDQILIEKMLEGLGLTLHLLRMQARTLPKIYIHLFLADISSPNMKFRFQKKISKLNKIFQLTKSDIARTYLQPHYGDGIFGNVYLSAGQH